MRKGKRHLQRSPPRGLKLPPDQQRHVDPDLRLHLHAGHRGHHLPLLCLHHCPILRQGPVDLHPSSQRHNHLEKSVAGTVRINQTVCSEEDFWTCECHLVHLPDIRRHDDL